MTDNDPDLVLSSLSTGLPGVTSSLGSSMVEAACVCLSDVGHESGVTLFLEGDFEKQMKIIFDGVDDQARRAWADEQFCTEFGAYCISLLLAVRLTPLTVIERSRKGTGFDFWLGDGTEPLFTKKARMEISGIRRGNPTSIKSRLRKKKIQVTPTDGTLPAHISIVEFGKPKAIFEAK